MKIRVNRYDEARKIVDVTFSAGGVKHRREINAVVDGAGAIDREATAQRLEEVGRGVSAKIASGAIAG